MVNLDRPVTLYLNWHVTHFGDLKVYCLDVVISLPADRARPVALQPPKDTAPVKLVLTTQHVLVLLFFDVLQTDGAGKRVSI